MAIVNNRVAVTCGTNTVGVLLATATGNVNVPTPITIYNPGVAPIIVGGPTVIAASGFPIAPGASRDFSLLNGETVYAVCNTVTTTANVMIGNQ